MQNPSYPKSKVIQFRARSGRDIALNTLRRAVADVHRGHLVPEQLLILVRGPDLPDDDALYTTYSNNITAKDRLWLLESYKARLMG